jgi:hypothetical protein
LYLLSILEEWGVKLALEEHFCFRLGESIARKSRATKKWSTHVSIKTEE